MINKNKKIVILQTFYFAQNFISMSAVHEPNNHNLVKY